LRRRDDNFRRSSCDPWLNVPQYLHEPHDVGVLEHTFDAIAIEVGEGGFVG